MAKTNYVSESNNELVRMYRRSVHFIPVLPGRKRIPNYHAILPMQWGEVEKYEITARESLNPDDLLVQLAVVKAFQDHRGQISDGGAIKKLNVIIPLVTLIISQNELCRLAGKNATQGDRQHTWQSLQRLADVRYRWHLRSGSTIGTSIIVDVDRMEDIGRNRWQNFVIVCNKNYLQFCDAEKYRLSVSLDFIKNCRTNVGKLLVYWLQGQKNNTFREDTLFRMLMLTELPAKKARERLRRGFRDAQNTQYIAGWGDDIRNGERVYHIERSKQGGI